MGDISVNLYNLYLEGMGETIDGSGINTTLDNCSSPALAFACLSAYFAGLEQAEMDTLLDEYEAQYEVYTECLTMSRFANEQKAEAGENGKSTYLKSMDDEDLEGLEASEVVEAVTSESLSYVTYMGTLLDGGEEDFNEMYTTKGYFTADEWGYQCDIINQQKDIESTELNKLSTDMELSVQDSSEAQEMAANAIKKVTDLASSQAKASAG